MNQKVTSVETETQQAVPTAAVPTAPTVAARPMTEAELREIAAQEAAQNARHDAAVHHAATREGGLPTAGAGETIHQENAYHDSGNPAVTGTGTGDNRDETSDPEIAAALGGVGGAIVGAAAGAMLGPVGALAGAVVGGLTGLGAAGLAVDVVDKTDDDTTLSGLPDTDRTNVIV